MAVPGYKTFFDYMIPKMFVLVNIEISSKLWGEAILGKVLRRKTVQVECCRQHYQLTEKLVIEISVSGKTLTQSATVCIETG